MSSFSVKFCFRVSCQIFFLLLLFAKNVCKFIGFGFDSHVKLTLKYSAKLLAFDEISILKGKKADGTKFSRVEFLSSLSFFFLFFSIYKGIWWSVFLALETFCERGVNSLRLTCTPFDLFFVHQPRFAAFNVFEKFASVLLQVPTPECLSFRLRNIPASIIAQQWCHNLLNPLHAVWCKR